MFSALDVLLDNTIFFLFLSYTFGTVVDQVLRRTIDYSQIKTFSLFKTKQAYERIGIVPFMRTIKPFTMNPGLKNGIPGRDIESLRSVRDHMTSAEIGHWAGAIFLLVVTVVAAWRGKGLVLIIAYLLVNLFGNVYFSLLQQYNKRKLDSVLVIAERLKASRE